ncbi:MAG: hypothetical protein JWM91_2009 [Rhodospirillales bacterium]|nr:hypothetical protein [Rhodospirillales bacterium]
MTLETAGDKNVIMPKRFGRSPEAVYRARTEPSLIQKWLLGADGWTMPVCVSDARAGGNIGHDGQTAKEADST